jgi:hypothetical protein
MSDTGLSSGMKKTLASSRGLLASLLLLPAILLGPWLVHRQLLQEAAHFWVVDEAVEPADAVAIFGGGIETRSGAAAEYFRQAIVHKILVTNLGASAERKSSNSHTDQNVSELKRLGVPDGVIELIGCNLSNTYQETLALKHWSLRAGVHSLILPTEYFSVRRVRWITQKVFQGTGVQVRVPMITSLDYLRGEWWNNSDALLAFQREVVKYVGYRVVYGLLAPWYEPGNTSERCAN